MLGNLVSLSLVALAVASAVPSDGSFAGQPGWNVKYRSVSVQRKPSDKLYNGPYYYIQDGACNAILNSSYLCGDEELSSIEVAVVDSVPYASVQIQRSSKRVVVSRVPSSEYYICEGEALVDLRLSCDVWKNSHSHNRLPLPYLVLDEELN